MVLSVESKEFIPNIQVRSNFRISDINNVLIPIEKDGMADNFDDIHDLALQYRFTNCGMVMNVDARCCRQSKRGTAAGTQSELCKAQDGIRAQ